jgi:hypothetical protein
MQEFCLGAKVASIAAQRWREGHTDGMNVGKIRGFKNYFGDQHAAAE